MGAIVSGGVRIGVVLSHVSVNNGFPSCKTTKTHVVAVVEGGSNVVSKPPPTRLVTSPMTPVTPPITPSDKPSPSSPVWLVAVGVAVVRVFVFIGGGVVVPVSVFLFKSLFQFIRKVVDGKQAQTSDE